MNRLVLLGLALVLLAGLVVAGWNWQQQREVQQAYAAGMAAADTDRYEEALALALPYADRHDPQIDHLLGMIYFNGPDGIKDIDKGLTYRRAAADAGNMQAAFYYGKWLIEKNGSEPATTKGLDYLTRAAECGMPIANAYLGSLLLAGELVPADLESGTRYSELAAWAGIKSAQFNTFVGYSLLTENIAPRLGEDINERIYWLIIAAENGNAKAKRIIVEAIEKSLNDGDSGIYGFHELARVEALRRLKMVQSPKLDQCGFNKPTL